MQKKYVAKYGIWLALLSWVPFVGDIVVIALGFYKSRPLWTILMLLVGKAGRFLVWNLLYGMM